MQNVVREDEDEEEEEEEEVTGRMTERIKELILGYGRKIKDTINTQRLDSNVQKLRRSRGFLFVVVVVLKTKRDITIRQRLIK